MLLNTNYRQMANSPIQQVLAKFNSSFGGISSQKVPHHRQKYGTNQLQQHQQTTWLQHLSKAFITPFTAILALLGIIAFLTDFLWADAGAKSLISTIIISVMILASGTMSLIQTIRSNHASQKLQTYVQVFATVVRGGLQQEIPLQDVVCGDVVQLAAGDLIPADLRLIETRDLHVAQSALTGESYPVVKYATTHQPGVDSLTDYQTLAFMGSNVVSGTALGLVIATGEQTQFGTIAKNTTTHPGVQTSFDLGIHKTAWLLIRFMAVMAPAVFLLNGLTKGNWLQALLFGLSMAVGLTPEMLPVIVTANLQRGALKMAQEGTVVKNINAIQNFGAMDILCTDKTGTLTQDKIALSAHLDSAGRSSEMVLRLGYLNSFFQTGLDNEMDQAIIAAAQTKLAINPKDYTKIDELPFDFTRRKLSTIVKLPDQTTVLITKGAIEEMLTISAFVRDAAGNDLPLTAAKKHELLQASKKLNQQGLRVLGLGIKVEPKPVTGDHLSVQDESDLIFVGSLAFADALKPSATRAVKQLQRHGVQVKIITGDNAPVTAALWQKMGQPQSDIITGAMLADMSPEQITAVVKSHDLFVKIAPEQKRQIVAALRDKDHVVGFLGDGINDASAMTQADVGVSVDSAVAIAKESADIILRHKDLQVLEQGVLWGRQTFGNIMKYIKATCSSNFGNMFSVLLAGAFLPFLPMQPLQLLLLNLIYDLSCLSIIWDRMDSAYLRRPKRWEAKSIGRFMAAFGPTSSIFDVTTYLLMFFLIGPAVLGGLFAQLSGSAGVEFVRLFNTGWFVESLWTQTLVLHALRTEKIPFIQSRASLSMTVITSLAVCFGSLLPYTGLGAQLGLVPLPLSFWPWLLATLGLYLLVVTITKKYFIKQNGNLL
ncbi:magnesium-translocating P-type ATPase [Agrilactobacillus composti DSM 18527 = JCM 14202]|uniref:Magnesium-transporting ATPase, P-type 1 n=1 Tax=Agrilactobacillus composti DSM 18527 = JCM 14202 TaxID=1423734 RepID=A0A0R1Y0R2_9LACO|nr:magnesium-translocating P-type ATPase [Agrilactobacillus composti]KRM35952.1 magnesium-translocating P-type ATPase [Agrilactobacillus composti DSM 18527 = JCM 14202]